MPGLYIFFFFKWMFPLSRSRNHQTKRWGPFLQVQNCWIMYWICPQSRTFQRSICMSKQTMRMPSPSTRNSDSRSLRQFRIIIWTLRHQIATFSVRLLSKLIRRNECPVYYFMYELIFWRLQKSSKEDCRH